MIKIKPKLKTKLLLTTFLTLSIFYEIATFPAIAAQETELDTVVVEAEKNQNIKNKGVLTDTLTSKDIENKQVDNVNDISRLDPAINYNRQNDSFNIRGLDGNRVTTMIDGIPIPWLDDITRGVRGGASAFDFGSLSAIDIGKGADSSIYGSGSLGGIVLMRTLDPEDLIKDNKNWGSITKGSYDSANRSWHINEAFAVKFNQTYMLFQGGYVGGKQRANNGDDGGYGVLRSMQNPEDFTSKNYLFKIHQYINDQHRLGFTAERFDNDRDTWVLNQASAQFKPASTYQEQNRKRERYSASYDYYGNGDGWLDRARIIGYWQENSASSGTEQIRLTTPKGDFYRISNTQNRDYGLTFDAMKVLNFEHVTHTLRIAGNGSSSRFKQYTTGHDTCPPPPYRPPYMMCKFLLNDQSEIPTTRSTSWGISIEDEMAFLNNRVRITPGGRFDWFKHKPSATKGFESNVFFHGYAAEVSDSHFSPKLRGEWDATDNIMLYAQWAQSFRAPSSSELYLEFANPGIYHLYGNPNLKPEIGNGFDIGAKYTSHNWGGSLGLFSNYYKNFIGRKELGPSLMFPSGEAVYINRAKVRISGVEAKAYWQITSNWRTDFSLAYMEGKDRETDEYLNSIPPLKGTLGLGYAQEIWGADIRMTAASKRNRVENKSDYAKAPGYAVFDISGWWRPLGEKGPKLQAGIYNIFNKTYWNALDLPSSANYKKAYYSEPGRNFKISFVQEF